MSDCRFGVSPVNYPDPDPDPEDTFSHDEAQLFSIFIHSVFYRCSRNLYQVNIPFSSISVVVRGAMVPGHLSPARGEPDHFGYCSLTPTVLKRSTVIDNSWT